MSTQHERNGFLFTASHGNYCAGSHYFNRIADNNFDVMQIPAIIRWSGSGPDSKFRPKTNSSEGTRSRSSAGDARCIPVIIALADCDNHSVTFRYSKIPEDFVV